MGREHQELNEEKFYEKLWFAWVMLFTIVPLGIFLLWKYSHMRKVPRVIVSVLFGFIFLLALIPTDEDTTSSESVEVTSESVPDEVATEEKAEESEEKTELYIDLVSATNDKETVTIEAETNVADGVKINISLEQDMLYILPASAVVEDGKLEVTLGGSEDEYVVNGTYNIFADFSTAENDALVEAYGHYDEFVANYEVRDSGEIEETDDGYKVNDIEIGTIEIKDAYSEEEVEKILDEQLKAEAKTIEYAKLEKNPDRYAGEYVTYTGEIVQIMEDEDFTVMRLAVTKTSYGYDINDIIYVEYEGLTDFVEEDIVTIYGQVYGSYTYQSQAGWDITVPAVIADFVE